MIPISFSWDSQKRCITLQWNGFFSFGLEKGKSFVKIFGIPLPIRPESLRSKPKKTYFPMQWSYFKGAFSFLRSWKLKKVEGTISFPDPMANGLLYGWMNAFRTYHPDQNIHMTINFLGENWCRGEAVLSLKSLIYHIRKWIFPLIRNMKKGSRKRR
jgi:hypothetical protein